MCISIPSRSCATCITSLLHTDHVSPQHMPWYLHPTSIQVLKITSQLHPSPILPYSGLMMCTSTQSRSHLSPTQMSIFVFHLYPGNVKPWSRSRDLHLTSKEVPSHLHPGCRIRVSAPSRSHLTPIQVWKFASKLHPCSVPPPSTSRSHLISIQVQIFASHIHPGDVYRPSRSQDVHHTSIQVLSHLHPNSNILISPPSMYCLTSIQVRSFVSHLHPCDISPPAYSLPFKSWYLHHSSIHVISHTNPRLNISAWTPSISRLTSIQVPRLGLISIQVAPQPGLGPEYLVLVLVVLEYLISVLVLVLRPLGT